MAGGAKCETVSLLDDRMKPTPENNAEQGTDDKYNPCCFIYSLTHGLHRLKKAPYSRKGLSQ